MLEPSTPNTIPDRTQPPPPPVEIDGEEEFEISDILDSKIDAGGSANCNICWIPADEVHASEAVTDFHSRNPDKPGPLGSL
ncbi:hypothetical protein NLI96_g13329 [Meripilus lineatus]|uniref:Uncharacterized protein n=1 Tax=Meripilus lineatus TaxID=2056292 RepID=A0AAD5UQ56_9APHY|nr:hypothetical protein NLI96_g13329 [Physisporinus lineatus]